METRRNKILSSRKRELEESYGINFDRDSLSKGGEGETPVRGFGFPRNRRDVIQFPRSPKRRVSFSPVIDAATTTTSFRVCFFPPPPPPFPSPPAYPPHDLVFISATSTRSPLSFPFHPRAYVREILHPFSLSLPPPFFPSSRSRCNHQM